MLAFVIAHARWFIAAGAAIALFLILESWNAHVWHQGYEAAKAEDAQAMQAYEAKLTAAQTQVQAAVAQGEAQVAQARATRPAARQAAQAAAQSVPEFAKTQRPADLAEQRRRELEAIARAVGGN